MQKVQNAGTVKKTECGDSQKKVKTVNDPLLKIPISQRSWVQNAGTVKKKSLKKYRSPLRCETECGDSQKTVNAEGAECGDSQKKVKTVNDPLLKIPISQRSLTDNLKTFQRKYPGKLHHKKILFFISSLSVLASFMQ